MRYIDVTMPIHSEMPLFPGDPPVELKPWSARSAGADFNVTALSLGTHTGTHVDAPAHCIDGVTAAAFDLDTLCGAAFVLDLAGALSQTSEIQPAFLAQAPSGCKRLLLRTHTGEAYGRPDAMTPIAGLNEAAARLLVERGVCLIGIDRLSVAAAGLDLAVHRLLLGAGLVILEGLDLAAIEQGAYELLCLPLRIGGSDGAPVRAILVLP